MLKRFRKAPHEKIAEKAARESAPRDSVGKFLGTVAEDSHTTSYRFESKLKGYNGWEWTVVVFQGKKSEPATISELVLLPGKTAITAPKWVPWSERKAELEKTQEQDLALSNLEKSEDAEQDSEDAAQRPPIRQRLRKHLIKNQDKDKSQKPRKRTK